jgi:alanine-glyoxylate transaminase/serine-glyoxylate transaminase/serine-pyruvate transaminase
LVHEEGLPARFARHRAAHERLALALAELGLPFVSQEGCRLPMLNAVAAPRGYDEAVLRRRLLMEHGIEIGGGLGDFKGRAWRIGLMGQGASSASVDALAGALRACLA